MDEINNDRRMKMYANPGVSLTALGILFPWEKV